jgi:hypothetical protein
MYRIWIALLAAQGDLVGGMVGELFASPWRKAPRTPIRLTLWARRPLEAETQVEPA